MVSTSILLYCRPLVMYYLILIFTCRLIASHNRANKGFSMAVNHLADSTPEELKVLRGKMHTPGYNGGQPFPYDLTKLSNSLPEQFDWRIYGAVTPVKGRLYGTCC